MDLVEGTGSQSVKQRGAEEFDNQMAEFPEQVGGEARGGGGAGDAHGRRHCAERGHVELGAGEQAAVPNLPPYRRQPAGQ